ncbi:unnamed protein product [Microthlaspi erraticum]|uniref:ADP-ribosyl cyclase/cyclic ADP-ribose hydrolase n=1 Tax=Microthlaspi erraticum TaxID=1685480 RepID=A0A6D2JHS2_9BRAS|nr:unnamed protein product [Microthlaspi erraticum]
MDSSPSPRVMKQYQVFLSFRGEDTRRTIVSHLHKALLDRGIDTFKDDKRLEIGASISDEIKEAIENSKIAVVVISENYASSTWCLNELQMIMELHKREQLIAVPVFYDVTPSDVRHQRNTFSLERYYERKFMSFLRTKTEEAEKVQKWREALTEIAGITGKVSRTCDNEAMMVDDIARRISRQLISMEPIDLGEIVGMKAHMERLNPLLKLESNGEVRMIGIWGMGGVGKTTIAKFLYKIHSEGFAPHRCFIENVGSSKGKGTLLDLQGKLLSSIVGAEHETLWSVEQGRGVIKSSLRNRRVFLVVDDIDNLDQLHALAEETSWFGAGSRIIVTTRDKGLFSSSGVRFVYHVDVLDNDNAIQVLKRFAFEGGQAPSDIYQRLAIQASSLAQGLPSALQAFGMYLRRMTSTEEWEMAMRRLQKIPQQRIMDILRTSYKGLDRKHKAVFLHVACVFNGDSVQSVKALLEDGDLEIKGLAEKSLIDLSADGNITMHVLVEQAGKEIAREESGSEPHNQRIFWEHEQIISALQNNTVTASQNVLRLVFFPCLHFNQTDNFSSGRNFYVSGINFLKVFRHVDHKRSKLLFIQGKETLPQNLLLLHWDGFPLTSLPRHERLRNIVEINLRHSNLERLWDGNLRLRTLRRLDVTCSSNLREPPDLSHAPNLEELLMEGCKRLEQLPKSIGSLFRLKNLNLSQCDGLANLQIHVLEQPFPLESGLQRRKITVHLPGEINKLTSLVNLSIDGSIHIQLLNLIGDAEHISYIPKQLIPNETMLSSCYNFLSLNIKRTRYNENGASFSCISFSDFHSLTELKLINLNILNIPDDIGQMQSLEKLDLTGNDFKNLPIYMTNLSKLKYVRLSNCTKLEALPELTQLQTLKLSGCSNLRSLMNLSLAFHKRVRYCLLELGLDNCRNFKSLSYQVRQLTSLIHLDLSRHEFEAIPESIKELSSLGTLCLNNCKKLKSVKDLPKSLKHLYAHGCDSLKHVSLPSNHSIEQLDLSHCFSVKQDQHLITRIFNDGFSQVVTERFACLPGTKVPSCIDNQALGASTKISLLPVRDTPKLLGFAACIVIACKTPNHLQFPAFTYSWSCEADGVIRINLKPSLYLSPEMVEEEEEETAALHHLVIIHIANSINTEEFDELRLESHLRFPEDVQIPPGEIKACGIRVA